MKLKQWLYGATALAMLAACSDKDIVPGDDNPGTGRFETIPGESYLGITLQLPEQPSTRAEGDEDDDDEVVVDNSHINDRFDDGIAAEYNVKNAALLLFWGDSEEDAEFIGAYPINTDERFDNPNGDNITTSFQNVATLNKKIESDGTLWGLAIVNYDETVFIIDGKVNGKYDSSSPNYGKLTVKAKRYDKVEGKTTDEYNTIKPYSNVSITMKTKDDAGMTFSDFRLLMTNDNPTLYAEDNKGLNIFMTNAPLCDSKGETANPNGNNSYIIQTLTKLDVEKIFESKQEAKTKPAGCIFVERAVAKVTISAFPEKATLKYQSVTQGADGTPIPGEIQDVELRVVSVSCMIDNEELDSYYIRNAVKGGLIGGSADEDIWDMKHPDNLKYRFVGAAGMDDKNPVYDPDNSHKTASTWYRTYWCKDPHYSQNKVFNEQATTEATTYKNLISNGGTLNTSLAFYPRENTFSLANQNYQNTTRVVFKVKYQWMDGDKNLNVYCRAGDPTIIYKKDDASVFLSEAIISSNVLHDFILKYVDLTEAKKQGIAQENEDGSYSITYGVDDFDITTQTVQKDDEKLLQVTAATMVKTRGLYKSLKVPAGEPEGTTVDGELTKCFATVMQNANEEVQFRSFEDITTEKNNNNVCYYAVNIQHFGDTYCPMPEGYKGITTTDVYGDNKAKYLGRWGMVRNNWYDLTIDLIKNMGFADVPKANVTTSDDNNKEEYYLSARVHVLSWAKRTQSVSF